MFKHAPDTLEFRVTRNSALRLLACMRLSLLVYPIHETDRMRCQLVKTFITQLQRPIDYILVSLKKRFKLNFLWGGKTCSLNFSAPTGIRMAGPSHQTVRNKCPIEYNIVHFLFKVTRRCLAEANNAARLLVRNTTD